jgi:hypothetical protein
MLTQGVMDDSSLLDMPSLQDKPSKKARKAHDFWSTPSRDAIEDEGEPEELFHDLAANVPLHTSIDKSAGHWWGPFRFDHVRRVITRGQNRGSIEMQWQVTCLYHHDKDDPEATKCRKQKVTKARTNRGQCVASSANGAWMVAVAHLAKPNSMTIGPT